jgi:hypothetical protein
MNRTSGFAPQIPPELLPLSNASFPLPDGQIISVLKASPSFSQCEKPRLFDDFGGKPTLLHHGEPCFAELVIQRIFATAGWSARWVETYGAPAMKPRFLTGWDNRGLRAQLSEPLPDPAAQDILDAIARENRQTYSGCWDVVAWGGGRLVFAETKRNGQDRIRLTQQRWVASALAVGIPADSFIIVEWSAA